MKFTKPGGEIILSVTSGYGRATLEVRDIGIGVSPEMAPHLFETSAQGDRTLDRTAGGLGLGLALVKGLVEPTPDRSR